MTEPSEQPSEQPSEEHGLWRPEDDDAWGKFYSAPAGNLTPAELRSPPARDSRRMWQVVVITLVGLLIALDWWRFLDSIGNGMPDVFGFGWFVVRIMVSIGYLVYVRRVL